jgi:hypothetical protein
LVADLSKQALDGGESSSETAALDRQVELFTGQAAGVRLENVSAQVNLVLNRQLNALALFRNLATSLDVAVSVATAIHLDPLASLAGNLTTANGAEQQNLLEVGNVDRLAVDDARLIAGRALSGESVDLVVDDLRVESFALIGGGGLILRGIRVIGNAQFFILFVGTEVFAALVLLGVVLTNGRGDPAVSSVVVQADGEGEAISFQNILQLVDNGLKSIMEFGGLLFAGGLIASETFVNLLNQTLNICQLTVARWRLNSQGINLECGDIALDDLLLHVVLVLDDDGVRATFLLDLTGGLDRVVLEVAVLAFEGLEDNITEVGNANE